MTCIDSTRLGTIRSRTIGNVYDRVHLQQVRGNTVAACPLLAAGETAVVVQHTGFHPNDQWEHSMGGLIL